MGQPVLPIRGGLVHGPTGCLAPRPYCSPCPQDLPRAVVRQFSKRWPMETTVAESSAPLDVQTQRPWSALAIKRFPPVYTR
jgi:hypothetical protein